jgi:hypothetical protein
MNQLEFLESSLTVFLDAGSLLGKSKFLSSAGTPNTFHAQVSA